MKSLISTTLILLSLTICQGQEKPDNQYFEVSQKGFRTLNLHNLRGDVEVRGTDTKNIQVTIKRQLTAKRQALLTDAPSQYYFDTLSREGNIYFFMESPTHEFKIESDGLGYYNSCDQWNRDNRPTVNYRFDITVEFPKAMNLNVSSHHDALRISDVGGTLNAKSHHKDLVASRIGGNANLKSHHGDVEASFTENPSEACSFSTHHGDIRIAYQSQFSADVKLKSRHGEFFTEYDWESQPITVSKEPSEKGTSYKVGDGTYVTIGGGGPLQSFSTWHGHIYLVKN